MIALTGATGALGSRVARLLASAGHEHRLLVRDPGRVTAGQGVGVARIDDYNDSAGARSGLAGCDTLLLVSARESADRVAEHRSMIDAAVAAGVGKIIYISFQGAAPDATFTFARDHWHTEQLIEASGLSYVALRDSFYLGALAALAGTDGVIRGPAADGRVAGVSHDDVAAVAATALTGDEWNGQTLDVTGPESLTLAAVAEQLSLVSGRPVSYHPESETEAYASRAHYGAPAFEVAGWVSSYLAIARGEVAAVADTVERVTGRPPQSFAHYLRTNPSSWSHLRSPS